MRTHDPNFLKSVADVCIYKLVLLSYPSCGHSLAGTRQLQLVLINGRMLFGTEFKGANYALGQLVFYRTKSQYKPKLDPNASPALMAGWKLEFGLRFKGVLTLLDYQALREGNIVCVQAPDREVYTRDKVTFPLSDVAAKALENFADPSTDCLERPDPLPIPFIEDTPKSERRPNESTSPTAAFSG